jgi:hypothetical protein
MAIFVLIIWAVLFLEKFHTNLFEHKECVMISISVHTLLLVIRTQELCMVLLAQKSAFLTRHTVYVNVCVYTPTCTHPYIDTYVHMYIHTKNIYAYIMHTQI